jgi:quinol monooxygenase YgiN
MFGRVTEITGSPDRVDDAIRQLREQVVPAVREMPGAKGFVAFVDRESGRTFGISLWESREAMEQTRDRAASLRSGAAQASGGEIAGVTEYEMVLDERF